MAATTARPGGDASARQDPAMAAGSGGRKNKSQGPSIRYPFWFGGSASSMAACVTHPLDLVKVWRTRRARRDGPV
ncbi:hypothetical protein CDD83_3244 [Cordyceps sp. RAO-2017]|nr:hypothetical protein CDD83_3244 [Cordyceps sp. RAO-2017]